MDFFYDASGNAYALKYNGILYYYITNLQGDVMSIVDAQGAVVASYNYDPYGNLISDELAENTVGHLNPLRYRAYYYDSETGFYYLQSRYYDPEIGRFLNADSFASTGQGLIGNNIFGYCLNNPVLYLDNSGNSASLPPMIENGLNLPAGGGIPVVIEGSIYYYAISVQNGQLYEYWFDINGNLAWGRHHTDHNKPWKHSDPHDHKGGKDKDGNNTLIDGPQPVNEKFQPPEQFASHREDSLNEGYIVAGIIAGVVVYQIAKWTIATVLAPATGGSSYAVAALAP